MVDILVWAALVVIAFALLLLIVNRKFSAHRAGIASLTAFHDFQPKDKQEAIEIMIEDKQGKKWEEQESGQGSGD
jgi:hypothetical protein